MWGILSRGCRVTSTKVTAIKEKSKDGFQWKAK